MYVQTQDVPKDSVKGNVLEGLLLSSREQESDVFTSYTERLLICEYVLSDSFISCVRDIPRIENEELHSHKTDTRPKLFSNIIKTYYVSIYKHHSTSFYLGLLIFVMFVIVVS